MEVDERQKTGIDNLKVGYNKVFGYYIQVSNGNKSKVPLDRYTRKQTLTNAERYITPELKEHENLIMEAQTRSTDLEYDLFVKSINISESEEEILTNKLIAESDLLLEELKKIKIGNIITINRLIETSLGLETGVGVSKKLIGINTRYTRKMLNYLYKMNRDKFLINFKSV